LTIDISLNR